MSDQELSIPKPVHRKAEEVLDDNSRFQFLLVGRRGGKTTTFVEDILESCPSCPATGEIFYIGPTNQMANELVWDPIQDRLDELGWEYYARVSKQRFELSRGRKIYVIGAEKIRRVRGHKLWRAYLDELAYYQEDLGKVWKAVRPALSDLKGKAKAGTTPNGMGTQAYDFYKQAKASKDWTVFEWDTLDNPFIDPDEVEAARREMDQKSFDQEYRRRWVSFEGLAYYNYDEGLHTQACADINWRANSIGLSYDFNVNPTTTLIIQSHGRDVFVRREYSLKNSSTIATTEQVCQDLIVDHEKAFPDPNLRPPKPIIDIHGDSAGKNRQSSAGKADYEYVQEILTKYGFQWRFKVMSKNPHPPDRLSHVNAYLKNTLGEIRLHIDPGCTDLHRDLSSQELDGRYPSDKNNLGHKGDALGYYICWKHIAEGSSKSTVIQL